jgi:ribosome-associated toxin RatA of RatAB toxin-antitoxin module
MDFTVRDVTDEIGTKGLEAVFQVDVPPDALLEIVWVPENFPRLFPEIREARVLRREESTIDIEFHVHAIIKEIRYSTRRTIDRAARTITWKEIGGDLKRVRGGWIIQPGATPETSRATYRAFIEVGRFVPTGLVREGAKRKLGEMVTRVRSVAAEIHRKS